MTSRRDFLAAFRKPLLRADGESYIAVRPPYGQNESLFQKMCPACESKACVSSCEEQIIVICADGTPTLNFTKNGCTFCEECAKACEKNETVILSLSHTHTAKKIYATFRISTEECIAHHKVICFACKEPCIDDAILFNGMFNPVIDMDRCTGCGFCISRCPTQAISCFAIPITPKREGSPR